MEPSTKCGLFPPVGTNAGLESTYYHDAKYLIIRKSKQSLSSFQGPGIASISLYVKQRHTRKEPREQHHSLRCQYMLDELSMYGFILRDPFLGI